MTKGQRNSVSFRLPENLTPTVSPVLEPVLGTESLNNQSIDGSISDHTCCLMMHAISKQ
jgi:hypothetical protein